MMTGRDSLLAWKIIEDRCFAAPIGRRPAHVGRSRVSLPLYCRHDNHPGPPRPGS